MMYKGYCLVICVFLACWRSESIIQAKHKPSIWENVANHCQDTTCVVFFDLDETVVAKDTCVAYGFPFTDILSKYILKKESEHNQSPEIFALMESNYYSMPFRHASEDIFVVVSNMQKKLGVHVHGLTHNTLGSKHSTDLIHFLSNQHHTSSVTYPIFTSLPHTDFPRTKATAINLEMVGGVLYRGSAPDSSKDKGAMITEYLRHANTADKNVTAILVDNTLSKLQVAAATLLSEGIPFVPIWYTEVEDSVTAECTLAEFRALLDKHSIDHSWLDDESLWERSENEAENEEGLIPVG